MTTVIAIDGPAGAGKSTLARRLAVALRLPYVNTGSMYRAVAAAGLREGIDPDDGQRLAELSRMLRFGLRDAAGIPSLEIEGAPPDESLVDEPVEAIVSRVARHPEVRGVLRDAQRRLGAGGAVMEGRDIGTVVFPEAPVKVFLEATEAERAARRVRERGEPEAGRGVAEALRDRDREDSRVNPLSPAPDAIVIDTTGMSPEEAYAEVLRTVLERLEKERD
ncbi:MAG TPA: (d)CMP kinase [Actinomycetota bacterium]|nr:(d)CMP kinase [Actinomycetota bacterium]